MVKVISALGVQTEEAPAPDLWSSVAANAIHLGTLSRNHVKLDNDVLEIGARMEEMMDISVKDVVKHKMEINDQMLKMSTGICSLEQELHQKVFPVVQDVIQLWKEEPRVGHLGWRVEWMACPRQWIDWIKN